MMRSDEKTFRHELAGFIAKWEVREDLFINYFVEYYANRCDKWAVCFRNPDMPDTTGHCESWHRVFKYKFMQGKQNIYIKPLMELLLQAEESYYNKFMR
jgi:hypothetical protein